MARPAVGACLGPAGTGGTFAQSRDADSHKRRGILSQSQLILPVHWDVSIVSGVRLPWPPRGLVNTISDMRPEFVFVLEQSLGHGVYGARLERGLTDSSRISTTFIHIAQPDARKRRIAPLSNYTLQASWEARSALSRRAGRGPIDALFIHTQCASLLARGVMRTVPTVISMDATPINYDSLADAYGHQRQGSVAESLKQRVYQGAFARAAAIVVWSRWAADSLLEDYGVDPSKVRVIPPGVDLTRFSPGPPRARGPVRILFVGGDLARKGGHDLLQALPGLGGMVECDLVTAAPVPAISTGATVRVHRDVSPDSSELIELYRRADIFAFPTHGDCYGQVIIEAMACGLPVVTCPVGPIPHLVRDGVNGLLVPPAAPEALAAALRTLVDRADLRRAMGARNLELTWSEHDAQRSQSSLVALMLAMMRHDQGVGVRSAVA